MRLPVVLLLALISVAAAEDWKARLADVDAEVRVKAANALAESGAADAVPELVECLFDRYTVLQAAAARALGCAGAAAEPALPELRRLLASGDRAIRAEALAAIARIGDLAAVAGIARHDRSALQLLGTDHDDVLRALLGAESWHVRLWIVQLKHVRRKPPGEWTEPLARLAADDPAQAVRVQALLALTTAPAALPHLRGHLTNADPRMRGIAVAGLPDDIDDATARAVAKLLLDPVPQLRARAAYALRARPDAAAAIGKLLDDEDENVRETAAVVLASQGRWRDDTGAVVVEAALHWGFAPPFPLVGRRRNLRAGGGSSIRAHEYYPYLDLMAHRAVLAAKAKATPYLARALAAEPDAFRRGELVHALGHAGATEELVAALRDDDSSVRRRAAFCLVVLGDRSFTALREVIACLENDEDEPFPIDWAATTADTLVKLGKEAIPLLEARLRKLENESAEQERIEEVLARIRKKSG